MTQQPEHPDFPIVDGQPVRSPESLQTGETESVRVIATRKMLVQMTAIQDRADTIGETDDEAYGTNGRWLEHTRQVINELDPQESELLHWWYGLGVRPINTPKSVAGMMDLDLDRVLQLEGRAMAHLTERLYHTV